MTRACDRISTIQRAEASAGSKGIGLSGIKRIHRQWAEDDEKGGKSVIIA